MSRHLIFILTIVAAARGAGQAQVYDSVAADVRAFEDARFAAMVKADTAALARMLADDLIYVHSTGSLETKDEFLNAIGARTLRYMSFMPEERRVIVLNSSSAVIVGRVRGTVMLKDRQADLDARYTGVYHRVGDGWKLRAWQSTRISQF